ncbi:MAG: type II toxin-antitoxin system HicA family toxin [SAR324 cluster bacterium]|nr:type II toxin-antitoxin system HicA family toxin [SAR324 cluster bacterium]
MANPKKLLQKAQNSPNNIKFEDVVKLAELVGFRFKRQKGTSHKIFDLPGTDVMLNLQSVKGKGKPYQVEQLVGYIEEYNLLGGEDE